VVEHLVDRGDLPELVLVGVGYVGSDTRHSYRLHRSRDYTPAFSKEGGYGPAYQKQSGGGPRFVEFIADELIPAIEETYRGDGERVLVGHSYGGLFAAWTMLSRPELFRRYLVVSPSLWYKDHMMLDFAKLYVKSHTELIADAFFTVGDREVNERWNMPADLENFYVTLTDKPLSVFRSELFIWEGETHNSVFPAALTRGLRFFWPRGTFTPAPAPP
jgi:predicted alpha/beta superfamily hydrolase